MHIFTPAINADIEIPVLWGKVEGRHALSGFLTFKAWLNEPLACSLRANISFQCCPMKTRKDSVNKHVNANIFCYIVTIYHSGKHERV